MVRFDKSLLRANIWTLTSRRWCVKFMESSKGLFCWRWPGSGSSCMKSRLCLPGDLRYVISFSSGLIIFQHNNSSSLHNSRRASKRRHARDVIAIDIQLEVVHTDWTRPCVHKNATEWDRTQRRGSETR